MNTVNMITSCLQLSSQSDLLPRSRGLQLGLQYGLTALAICLGFQAHAVQPLSTSGNKVLAGGQVASFAGNSLFWSNNNWGGEKFYNAGVVATLKRDWKSNIVRAAMGVNDDGGYLQDPVANKNRVKAVVDAAIANDMYVIIDWHTHHAEDYQAQSIAFFQEMARTYKGYPNVIYEIYNEPLQISWSGTIKPYANAVISAIRAIDPNNLIIVGTPQWSQKVDEASRDPITGYKNIAYTLHFYAGSHGQYLRDWATTALSNGIPLFVTEWGSVNASGDGGVNAGETAAWVDFMKRNNISNANWSLNDKAEGSSALVPGASPTGNWSASQLTASGTLAKNIISIWPGSPTTCTTVALPGTVEAEGYCSMSGVQTETTSDGGGGQNVGYIDSGDWMSYSVDVPAAGAYKVSYRVASPNSTGVLQLEQAGGSPVYGSVNVPYTGGWQTWTTVSHTVNLAAGKQNLGVSAKTGGFNLNWIKFEPSTPPTEGITIQGEDYLVMSGVKLENTSDAGGGLNVGYIDAGDWMSYPAVNIPSSGTYTVEYRVASLNGGGNLSLEEAGGTPSYGSINIPSTGGWQNWTTIRHTVNLSAGSHKLGIKANNGGWNLNWFRITKVN
ncbi:carbohydrate-binding protein [Undibacterium cyanobacteriorum]|uniref:Carbohydrate-binding protein n=1 Tax=Undibacterium cyanobacteriorum TaxID=3073561 RepID=A0ABY9RPI4_9BURK|nr:carbohydrate-binding protein [Undibacterium sp. 20NA77.5]WMW82180.1 carbohydrate-binding protein [Undibacterium sp. 20NA77.5]